MKARVLFFILCASCSPAPSSPPTPSPPKTPPRLPPKPPPAPPITLTIPAQATPDAWLRALYDARERRALWVTPKGDLTASGARLWRVFSTLPTLHGIFVHEIASPDLARALRAAPPTTCGPALEVALSMALGRLARRLRARNPAWMRDRTWPPELQDPQARLPTAKGRRQAARDLAARREHWRVSELLRPLFVDARSLSKTLRAMTPTHPQYAALQEAHRRYMAFEDQGGGWASLPKGVEALRQGQRHPDVLALKVRLIAEGLWPAEELSRLYTPKLTRVVAGYQRTHQLRERGIVTPQTLRSLNVGLGGRLSQIRVAMERWRVASPIGGDMRYAYVNVADFHMELWERGERTLRMKAVVGAPGTVWDRGLGHIWPHATKLFSASMTSVVFDPYWNVPASILEAELRDMFRQNRGYFEAEGFEWHIQPDGHRRLRQKPGPTNALGRVKFLFPNDHNIYMHDTPDQAAFRHPVRALSHGCVRLKEPMTLARHLLEAQGDWSRELGARAETPRWFTLTDPLPVHIDSISVRASGSGTPHFLADPYRRDRRAWAQRSAHAVADHVLRRVARLREE